MFQVLNFYKQEKADQPTMSTQQPTTSTSPRTRSQRKVTVDTNLSSSMTSERNTIAEELHKIRKALTSYNIRLESQNVRIDELSQLMKDNFSDLKIETNACSKSQAQVQKHQQARDIFSKIKRTQRRPMERFHHFYKHYVLNKCKADLFEQFLGEENNNGGKIFIPRKYRNKESPTVKNDEVLNIKKKESIQKMQNDISCMRAYATSHQDQALAQEKKIRELLETQSTDTEIKTLTMDHFEDWLQDTKNRCSEEWAKKESFFLKLQKQYLEGEISKTPKPQTEAEETNLTEMLMELADNTIVTSTPAIPRTQTNQERANNQPTQRKPKQATKHDSKQTGRRTDNQQNARDPPPHKPQIHNHPGRTRPSLPRNGFNHRNQHFVRSPSPQHRWAPDNHDFPPRPTYPIKPRYDWQPEPEMDHHSRYYAAPYIPPQYAQPSWAQPTPSRNQQQPPAQLPISSDGNQDFLSRLILKNLLR